MVKANHPSAALSSLPRALRYVILPALLFASSPQALADKQPPLPDSLADDPHLLSELGVNEFTAPSINRIFTDLQQLPEIPPKLASREIPEKLPLDRPRLAMELGALIADGFLSVQTNQPDSIRTLALQLSRYGKALGAGERVSRHGANLLKHAENRQLDQLKRDLALTQRDVEAELVALQDPDMAHLIGLGGWIRALDIAASILESNFDPAKAKILFRPEIPEYFNDALAGLDPNLCARDDISAIRRLLASLEKSMTLAPKAQPSRELVTAIHKTAAALADKTIIRKN